METLKNNFNKTTDLEDELHIHINSASKKHQNLQNSVNTMQSDLQNALTTVNTLNSSVATLQNTSSMQQQDINTLNTELSSQSTQITQLNTNINTISSQLSGKADVSSVPTKTSQLTNDSGFLTSHQSLAECIKQGDTLTKPLTVTGGDGAAAGKIILTSNGQITDAGTATLLGLSSGSLLTGHGNYTLKLRGSAVRPTYNNSNMALYADIPSLDTTPTNNSSNAITSGGVYSALLNKENTSNKVTAISSSSTDTQYPSAKCVYNAIQNAGGGGGGTLVMETKLYDFTAAPLVAGRNVYQTVCYIQAPTNATALITAHFVINTADGQADTTGGANIYIRVNNVITTQLLVAKGGIDTQYTLSYLYTGTGNKDDISIRLQSVYSTSKACLKSVLVQVLGQNINVTYQ